MVSEATLTLAANVRRLMDAEHLSQQALAKRAGVSQRGVSYVLNYRDEHDRHPSTETVEALARAFGLQAWQLMAPNLGQELHAARGALADHLDVALLSRAVETALGSFRAARRLPSEAQVAAAAAFIYTHVVAGRSLQSVAKTVLAQLRKAGEQAFADS